MLDQTSDSDEDFNLVVRSQALSNAAECYQRAGDAQTSMRLLEQRAHEFPRTKGVWMQLAAKYVSSPPDVEKVLECLRKENEIDPGFGEDPPALVALALAEITGDGFRTALRNAAERNPDDLRFFDSAIFRHWPGFRSLDETLRKEWIGAALLLWGARTPPELRELVRRRVAGAFADVAEAQLKRVFDRFKEEKGKALWQRASPDHRKHKFLKYLGGGHIGLGEMIFEIDDTRRLPEPKYPEFKDWLANYARRLRETGTISTRGA